MAEFRDIDDLFRDIESDPDFTPLTDERRAPHLLGRNVLRLRMAACLTQRELASRAGMRQPRIAEIEAAKGNPRFDTLRRVAEALGVSLAELVSDRLPIVEPVEVGLMTRVPLRHGSGSTTGSVVLSDHFVDIQPEKALGVFYLTEST
jgi:DNA-binding XRE family transcriptional regulator